MHNFISAAVLELVDETDSKSVASNDVWVRVPPAAPNQKEEHPFKGALLDFGVCR